MTGALIAGAATVVAAIFAGAVWRRYVVHGRRNRALVYWSVSLAMFAIASLALTLGEAAGWSPAWFRVFYLFGGVLVVPWLAMGSVQLATRDRVTLRVLGVAALVIGVLLAVPLVTGGDPTMFAPAAAFAALWGLLLLTADPDAVAAGSLLLVGTFTALGAFAVLSTALQQPIVAEEFPEPADFVRPLVRSFSVGGNAAGATLVIVGAVTSAWRLRGGDRPHLLVGNLLIALGTLIAAAGGFFAFLGRTAGHAMAFALGVAVMYMGFVRTTRGPTGPGRGEGGVAPERPHRAE